MSPCPAPSPSAVTGSATALTTRQRSVGRPRTTAPPLVLGLVLVGAGLVRARTVPVWEGALLIGGAVLVFLSAGGGMVAAALPLAPLGLALVLLGLRAAHA